MNDFQSAVAQNVKCSNPKPRTFLLHAPQPPRGSFISSCDASFWPFLSMAAPFWPFLPLEASFWPFQALEAAFWPFGPARGGVRFLSKGASFCLFVAFHRPCRMGHRRGFQGGILMAFQGRSRFATRCMTFISSSWLPFLSLCDGSPDLQDGQPLPPEMVGELSVGPRPTEHVQHIAPGTDAQQPDVHSKNKELGIHTALRTVQIPLFLAARKLLSSTPRMSPSQMRLPKRLPRTGDNERTDDTKENGLLSRRFLKTTSRM